MEAAARIPRDRLIIRIFRYFGLRISEVSKLDIEHVDFAAGTLLVACGKGDKDRYIPIPDAITDDLAAWVGTRYAGLMFPSPRTGRGLDVRTIRIMVDRTAQRAGITRHVHPHMLRHSYASTLLNRGANLKDVQDLLGHASLATTEVYLHVAVDRLRSAVNRL